MLIQLPFDGFYNSIHDQLIDDAVDQLFQDDSGDTLVPDSFIDGINYSQVFTDYCKMYVENYQDILLNEYGLDITLTFESMTSPREYNFETDKIFCEVSLHDVKKIYGAMASRWPEVEKVSIDRHTSRSGFISFYDPDVKTWGPLPTWDHNQLQTLLIAFADIDQYSIVENSYEDIHSIIDNALTESGADMVNSFYAESIQSGAIA